MKRITLLGDFTDSEFAEIVTLLRGMDTRRPEAHFEIIAEDEVRPIDAAKELLHQALPQIPGRYTDWTACDTTEDSIKPSRRR